MELLVTFLAGISVLAGALIVRIAEDYHKHVEHISMAIAMAALLSLLILDLLPEVAEYSEGKGWIISIIMILAGVALLKVLDNFIPEHEDNEHNHDTGNAVHIGIISSMAVGFHNIVEGMTVYSLTYSDPMEGIVFAIGIALHNIPMGMLFYTTMYGQSRREKAAVFSIVCFSTFAGGIIMALLSDLLTETVTGILVSLASGMVIYIVFMELLPHVLKTKEHLINIAGIVIGFAIVLLSTLLE